MPVPAPTMPLPREDTLLLAMLLLGWRARPPDPCWPPPLLLAKMCCRPTEGPEAELRGASPVVFVRLTLGAGLPCLVEEKGNGGKQKEGKQL